MQENPQRCKIWIVIRIKLRRTRVMGHTFGKHNEISFEKLIPSRGKWSKLNTVKLFCF